MLTRVGSASALKRTASASASTAGSGGVPGPQQIAATTGRVFIDIYQCSIHRTSSMKEVNRCGSTPAVATTRAATATPAAAEPRASTTWSDYGQASKNSG